MSEVRLGKLLLNKKLVTAGQIQDALVKQRSTPKVPLGQVLCQMGVLGEEHLARAIASQYDLPYMDIAHLTLDPRLSRILSPDFAQRHRIVPIAMNGQSIKVAMAFPLPRNALTQIEKFIQCRIIPVIVKDRDIASAMHQLFHIKSPAGALHANPSFEISENTPRDTAVPQSTGADIDPIVRKILALGISGKARDIHLESTENGMTVRYRIDGMLQALDLGKDKERINAQGQRIISRIMTLCDLDIAKRHLPQDGIFTIKAKHADSLRRIDLRVSTLPTRYRENVVIHLFEDKAY